MEMAVVYGGNYGTNVCFPRNGTTNEPKESYLGPPSAKPESMDRIQGPTIQISIVALICKEILKKFNGAPSPKFFEHNTVRLQLGVRPAHAFGLFAKFLYQGGYSSGYDAGERSSGPGSTGITVNEEAKYTALASFSAWVLGDFLGAPAFQNHALGHIYHSLGVNFTLEPCHVAWVYANTKPASPLRALVSDTLAAHWATPTLHVARQAGSLNAWANFFSKYPQALFDFLRSIQHPGIGSVHAYLLPTSEPAQSAPPAIAQKAAQKDKEKPNAHPVSVPSVPASFSANLSQPTTKQCVPGGLPPQISRAVDPNGHFAPTLPKPVESLVPRKRSFSPAKEAQGAGLTPVPAVSEPNKKVKGDKDESTIMVKMEEEY